MNYQRTTKFVLEICPLKSSNFSGFCSITLCSPNANQSYLYFMQNSMNHKGKLSWISDFVRSGVCRKKKNPLLLLKNLNSANTKPLKCIKQYVCDYTGHFRIERIFPKFENLTFVLWSWILCQIPKTVGSLGKLKLEHEYKKKLHWHLSIQWHNSGTINWILDYKFESVLCSHKHIVWYISKVLY
jgi:hypothetical protein